MGQIFELCKPEGFWFTWAEGRQCAGPRQQLWVAAAPAFEASLNEAPKERQEKTVQTLQPQRKSQL